MDSKTSRTESVNTLHTKKKMQHKRKSTSGSQPRDVNQRRASLSRRQNSSNGSDNGGGDDSMNWENMNTDWRRCETMWITWDGGHGPFNLNATSWPDDQPYGSDSGPLQWDIARLVGNHDYQWTGGSFNLLYGIVHR